MVTECLLFVKELVIPINSIVLVTIVYICYFQLSFRADICSGAITAAGVVQCGGPKKSKQAANGNTKIACLRQVLA